MRHYIGSEPRRNRVRQATGIRARWGAVAAIGALAATFCAVVTPPSAATEAPGDMTAAEVNAMFRAYGDAGGHWTGGDGTVSVELPDGRVAWLFSDTFLGSVNADGSRPSDSPMVNNTLVVQDGTSLTDTRHGGTPGWPEALVKPNQLGEFFWVGDAVVESDTLKVIYNRYARYGNGDLDIELTGSALATFALPGLTLTSVTDLPVGRVIAWGSALLVDGSHTYVYGTSSGLGGLKFAHVARVPAGTLGGAWQFWTGTAWSGSESDAARLLSGVGTAYAVQKVGSQYVLITQENNLIFDPQIVAYTATSPTGPWSGPTQLLTAPEQEPGSQTIVYHARLHPELARPGKLLLSYDVNSLDTSDVYADARLYRPRFVELDWPQPAPGPVPATPTGFTVTTDDAGVAHLSWSAVTGATGYRVYRRDVTGGQTHFVRQWQPVTETSTDVNGLITGHRYEFKVTATNTAGESPFSATVAATPRNANDASVILLSDTPEAIPGSYIVRFKDSPAVRGAGVDALAEEIVAQAGGTLDRLFPITLHGFSATLTESQAIDIAGHPDVEWVEQDQTVILDPVEEVVNTDGEQNDPPSWGLDRIDQRDPYLDHKYVYPNTGGAVRAYVLDTGVLLTHDTFNRRAVAGINTVAPRGPSDPPNTNVDDCGHGHGTHVAGTLGGTDYGVAKNVQIVAVKVLSCQSGQATSTSIADGVEWVTANADKPAVLNMSLSMPDADRRAKAIKEQVESAIASGLTVVATAGNVNSDACTRVPASVDGVITVANSELAVDGSGKPIDRRRVTGSGSGSGFGTCVDLFAPGTSIVSAGIASDTSAATKTGTSMAAPHVAGVVAMILDAHPEFTPAQVERVLVDSSTKGVVWNSGIGTPNRLLYVERPPTNAPTNLVATPNPDGTIALRWDAVPEPGVHYLVSQRDVTAQGSFERWEEPVFGATTATARGLQEGHIYEFRVAASNSMGVGPESNTARATAHMDPPGAPTNLTATANPNGTLTLEWSRPAPDVWYWVYQRDVTAGEADFTQLPLPITTCCTMTAGLLQHDHVYEFQVTAVNVGGEGPPSNTARARSSYPAPAAATGLTAVAGDGEVTLTWTASPTPNVWYWVYQRNVSAGETQFTRLPLPITTCCTMTAGFLTNDHVYEFKVTAIAQGGESASSNLVRATPRKPIPGKVTGLTATANTDGTITLRWTEPSGGPHYYEIYQRDVTAGETGFTKLLLPVTECCMFTAGLLTHNHVYEFKVGATNGRAGPLSDPAQATSRYSLPGPPTNLRGVSAGDGTVDLNWDAPGAGGYYYWIYSRDVTAGQTAFTKSGYPTDKTWASQGPLRHDHVYEFKVSAANPAGEGPASTPVQVTSRGGLPQPPTGLTATAGDGQVTLRWTASPTPGVLYNIYQRDASAGGSWQKLPLPVSGTSMTPGYLTNGHTYEFKVTASNASGDSAASNVASARPMPQPPTGLTAQAGDGKVTLRWTASPTPNAWYWIEYRPSGGTWQRLPYPLTTCCTHTVSYLSNGTTYDFRLRATSGAGDSTPSNVASARPMPPIPQPPTGLTAQAGDRKVTLRWTASTTPNVWYWIEYRPSGGTWQRLPYPLTTCCTHTVSYLSNGTTYDFRLRSTNLAGDSTPSNIASARPIAPRGRCSAFAFDPRFVFYPVGTYEIWATAYAACVGPADGVRVRATLYHRSAYFGWYEAAWYTVSWGNVGDYRSGYVTTYRHGLESRYACQAYIAKATVTWTNDDGSLGSAAYYSPTVWLNVDGRC